jgi:hypothetical protein
MTFFFFFLPLEPKIIWMLVDEWYTCVTVYLALLKFTDPNLNVYSNYEKQVFFS